jgi:hypothetical protein
LNFTVSSHFTEQFSYSNKNCLDFFFVRVFNNQKNVRMLLIVIIGCCYWYNTWYPPLRVDHQFLNTLDATHSNIHQQQTGWNTPQGFMLYLSTNFETRYLLSSCSNLSIDKHYQFSPMFKVKVASSVFRNWWSWSVFPSSALDIRGLKNFWHLNIEN